MQRQRPIPVLVSFGGRTEVLAISPALAEACLRELPAWVRRSAGEPLCDRQVEGRLALELARYVEGGLACEMRRALAAEDAALLIAGMVSPDDWRDARRIDLRLGATASPTRLELTLVLTRER